MTARPVVECDRCDATADPESAFGWNVGLKAGVVVGHLCPTCQTPEEDAEAEINDATLDYSVDHAGHIRGRPKMDGGTATS